MFNSDVVREFEVEGHGSWRVRGNGSYWAVDKKQDDGSWKEHLEQEPPPAPVFEAYTRECAAGTASELGIDIQLAEELLAEDPTPEQMREVDMAVQMARITQAVRKS